MFFFYEATMANLHVMMAEREDLSMFSKFAADIKRSLNFSMGLNIVLSIFLVLTRRPTPKSRSRSGRLQRQ
jgi:hypothetical protein